LKWLRLPLVRELKQEDFARLEARVGPDGESLVFPVRYVPMEGSPSLGAMVGLRRISYNPAGSDGGLPVAEENVPGPANPGETRSLGRLLPLPHGLDLAARAVGENKKAVLVSSVLDSVALLASGNTGGFHPVALAEGTSNLPPEHLPFLEDFERVALWLPNDTASFEASRAFSKKIGEKRCLAVAREVASPAMALKK